MKILEPGNSSPQQLVVLKIAAARTDRNQSIPGSGFIATEIGAKPSGLCQHAEQTFRGILETGKIQSCPKAWSLIQRFEKLVALPENAE